MVALADTQRQTFESRLDRIALGGPNTTATIYAGPTDMNAAEQPARRRLGGRGVLSILAPIVTWPSAFILGAIAMIAGRVAAFQLTLRPELLPPDYAQLILLCADFGVAAILMILLGWSFRLGGGLNRIFLCAGFVTVMMAEPLLIRQAPDAFVPIFSENYVTRQMAAVAPIETVEETLDAFSKSSLLLPALPSPAPTGG